MEQLEAVFEEFRAQMNKLMLEEGVALNTEEKIKFYKELIEDFRAMDDQPVLVKRMIIVIVEYEIELLETTPPESD